jgi:fatty-acid desaturase
MRVYNAIGYTIIFLHIAVSGAVAPTEWGPWVGMSVGFGYLLLIWFFGGIYLSNMLHMGIAHRALTYNPLFIKSMTLVFNTFGLYVNPTAWVDRHRHHHTYSDHQGDPYKREDDGFCRTFYNCLFPYKCISNMAGDAILKTWVFRLVSSPYFAVASNATSFGLLWLVFGDWKYSLALWLGVRLFAMWVNMLQNYWTHDRRFGSRRYNDVDDNAMNITEWLPITASFSACLQNNHHHHSGFLRMSHDNSEYDFGFMVVKLMKSLRLVEARQSGLQKPDDVALDSVQL